MNKNINADKLIKSVNNYQEGAKVALNPIDGNADYYKGKIDACKDMQEFIIYSLQQEPLKVYRVENEKEQKGLWRKFDGTWEPLFDMLTDGQCKDMPMEDSPIYREGGKQWFASAPSKETLQKWFSKRDLEELTAKGFTISEFEVLEYKKLSDFEFIFTRDSIISRTYLKVSDIYPQEQPEVSLERITKLSLAKELPEGFDKEWLLFYHTDSEYNSKKFHHLSTIEREYIIARHFWNKGYNARKEGK